MENLDVTITAPGMEPVHTTTDAIKHASEALHGNAMHNTREQLKSIIERVEHLEEEKSEIADQVKEVYAEAKGNGFDVTALKAIVRMRKQDADERQERETILETYMLALGMI